MDGKHYPDTLQYFYMHTMLDFYETMRLYSEVSWVHLTQFAILV